MIGPVFLFFFGFLLGLLSVLSLQFALALAVIRRLSRSTPSPLPSPNSPPCDLDSRQSLYLAKRTEGDVWILDMEGVPRNWSERIKRDPSKKKECVEVSPIKKRAIIKDHWLIVTEADGSPTIVQLKGCMVQAVSATSLSSKKWAKKFPIKLENKSTAIYKGSKIFFIYLETSWEKESWCRALRLASSDDRERIYWFSKLQQDFRRYLTSLQEEYPSMVKSIMAATDSIDKDGCSDASSSKARTLWKKITKKVTKSNAENKLSWNSLSGREEKRMNEKYILNQDPVSDSVSSKVSLMSKVPKPSKESNHFAQRAFPLPHSGSQSHTSNGSDVECDDKMGLDEGTQCWNLLISRLFFDAVNNKDIKNSVQAWIQRILSNMRTPSYIGELICANIDTGNVPPYIHGMRVHSMDMNKSWALDVDIEYSGGAILDVETRVEVSEVGLDKDIVDSDANSGSISSDLLESFEVYSKQLNLVEDQDEDVEPLEGKNSKGEAPRISKGNLSTSINKSRWKAIMNSIAKQVSQVPLSLRIRLASIRGTLRFQIKPPPSDQLWCGFTSMPDIEVCLEPSVGEHKVTSSHLDSYLINRFKASIRETIVLPNCESVCIPWMLAEKEDWIPRKVAPFIWLNQEAKRDVSPSPEKADNSPSREFKSKGERRSRSPSGDQSEVKSHVSVKPELVQTSKVDTMPRSRSEQELSAPLLPSDEPQDDLNSRCQSEVSVGRSPSRTWSVWEHQDPRGDNEEGRPKRVGRKARMLDLGKKMGEKLEEKRRHIEEKRRHIVEKMRGPHQQ
ncbi:hypothetical protein MLD38_028261 [Melastoma candidum]|uniref:Uncharacterized protein n=1 Tax=Melastoma candidum TaxID=119954 RepID=A0ACB9N234_9MYRT|nr:hypothetical protein MLD38_028261 [Melastoma candidum]